MRVRFIDRANSHIDRLVRICWESRDSHDGEIMLIPERDDDEIVQLINDQLDPTESETEAPTVPTEASQVSLDLSKLVRPKKDTEEIPLSSFTDRALVAVDSGIVYLGEFSGGGLACAVRGAAVCFLDDELIVLRYNTGPLLIDERNRLALFQYMGRRLGLETLYLDRLDTGELVVDSSVLGDANQIQDRVRNFVERMIQEEALGILAANSQGLLLLDGALPAGTFDTPVSYLRMMLRTASENRVDVAAVSKKTRIAVGGIPISALFDGMPTFIGYLPLSDKIARDRSELVLRGVARRIEDITLGSELYAARFGLGPPAATFRVDVHNSIRSSPDDVIRTIYSQCQIFGCYPRPLIDAHQFSSFLFQDVQLMTADVVARTGAVPKEDTSMAWMFEPFGAFGK